MNRKEQEKKRREEILKTSLDLFIKKGFHATRITDISKELNISVGLVYHYFQSKEDILLNLIKNPFMSLNEILKEDSPLKTLEIIISKILKNLEKEDGISAKLFLLCEEAQHLSELPEDVKVYLKMEEDFLKKSTELMKSGQERNEIRSGDPEALSIVLWCAIQGYAQHRVLHTNCPKADKNWFISMVKNQEV